MQRPWQVRTYFAPHALERFDLRARVKRNTRVSFWADVMDEPPLPLYPRYSTHEVTVVEEDPDRGHRVLYTGRGARLLLWVHPDDLVHLITEPVLVHLDPQPQPLASGLLTGVELTPGCVVSVNGHESVWADVSGGDYHFYYRGWVPDDIIGPMYRTDEPLPPFEPDVWLAPGAEIYDDPWGCVIGVFTANKRHPAQLLGIQAHDTVAVRYRGADFQVTGYVEQVQVERDEEVWSGWAVGRGFSEDSVRLHVPRGTCLYARPDGELVGVMVEDSIEEVEGVHDGWWHIPALWTPWREFDVWVEDAGPADVATSNGVIHRKLQQCEV